MSVDKKKLNGVVYTPEWIVDLILDKIQYGRDIYKKKIVDPSCGDGAFLTEIVKRFIIDAKRNGLDEAQIKENIENNIFGFDIDNTVTSECIFNLERIASEYGLSNINWKVVCIDSIDRRLISEYLGMFDFVVGNPPYIRIQHLGEDRRKRIQSNWHFCRNGSTDIFIAFFELGLELLNKCGKLGYITPNTYLKTDAGGIMREFIARKNLLETLIDFGHNQLFNNATTYSIITILSKNNKNDKFSFYEGNSIKNINFIANISNRNLCNDNWILASKDINDRLDVIENNRTQLQDIANIHVGITTLADDLYIFRNPKFNKDIAEITLRDGRTFEIEKNILKPIVKAPILKSANDEQNRYIIFPYYKKDNKHVIIMEIELERRFPLTYRYFLAVRNELDKRDKGKPNKVTWYAFGRSQGLDTSFGRKILTSTINLKPRFIVWKKENYTFYAGYCIKSSCDLDLLAEELNSKDMEFYISKTSRSYMNNYRSYAKCFIKKFGIKDARIYMKKDEKQGMLIQNYS